MTRRVLITAPYMRSVVDRFRPIFEELSGATVNIALVPISELYTKIFLDLRNGTGQYDAFMVGAFWYGDIVGGNYALPALLAADRRLPPVEVVNMSRGGSSG